MHSLDYFLNVIVEDDKIPEPECIHDPVQFNDKDFEALVKRKASELFFTDKGKIVHDEVEHMREHPAVKYLILDTVLPGRSFITTSKGRIYFSMPDTEKEK